MISERDVVKRIVENEKFLMCYQEKVKQAKEGEDIDYLKDEIERLNIVLNALYNLFEEK